MNYLDTLPPISTSLPADRVEKLLPKYLKVRLAVTSLASGVSQAELRVEIDAQIAGRYIYEFRFLDDSKKIKRLMTHREWVGFVAAGAIEGRKVLGGVESGPYVLIQGALHLVPVRS